MDQAQIEVQVLGIAVTDFGGRLGQLARALKPLTADRPCDPFTTHRFLSGA